MFALMISSVSQTSVHKSEGPTLIAQNIGVGYERRARMAAINLGMRVYFLRCLTERV